MTIQHQENCHIYVIKNKSQSAKMLFDITKSSQNFKEIWFAKMIFAIAGLTVIVFHVYWAM